MFFRTLHLKTEEPNFLISDDEPPNYGATSPNGLTPVGAFAASPGPYGTYDQGGDVTDWDETAFSTSYRDLGGGSFDGAWGGLLSAYYADGGVPPASSYSDVGFRVGYVPEPSTAAMLLAAAVGVCFLLSVNGPLRKARSE